MLTVSIPYGKTKLTVSVPEERVAGVLTAQQPLDVLEGSDDAEIMRVRRALAAPIDSPPLHVMAESKRRVLVITSDHTRPMPSGITLPILLEEIRTGNPTADIRILIATGTHRPMRQDEMIARFGRSIVDHETLINHRCDDTDGMVYKGQLPSGGALRLNGLIAWADLIVAEGFIEPHFFAGFSGGRKSILPGIASRDTVLYNHNSGFIQNPQARQGCLVGNPLHTDMCWAAEQAGLAFILNVILDENKRVAQVVAGHPRTAHEAGCDACLRRTSVARVSADVVITSNGGYPLDQNIYQSVKGMTAGEACVRRGGVIIMCAALGDGAGGEAFFRFLNEADTPQTLLRQIQAMPPEQTAPDQWEAQILARVLTHARVIFVTGEENRGLIEAMHMHWAADPAQALTMVAEWLGSAFSIALIPDGVGVVASESYSTS